MGFLTQLSGPVIPERKPPRAVASADPAYGVVGSIIKVDGSASVDPFSTTLTFIWDFVSVPIGSKVTREAFRLLDPSGSVVSFSPDIIGEYVVGLVVDNGVFASDKVTASVSVRAIMVPHGRGMVPDGKFVWSYIRDAWNQVEDKEWFETLWSTLIQLVGSEMLKTYQVDFNKSIRDIQDTFQRKWISYEPKLPLVLGDCSFFLGNHYAGLDATTVGMGAVGQAVILPNDELVVTAGSRLPTAVGQTLSVLFDSINPGNVGQYLVTGLTGSGAGYKVQASSPLTPDLLNAGTPVPLQFSFRSTEWLGVVPSDVRVGDIARIDLGLNTGYYTITSVVAGVSIEVSSVPPSFEDGVSSLVHKVTFYRPVGIEVSQPVRSYADTVGIPYDPTRSLELAQSRIVAVAGQAYTVKRTVIDKFQPIPLVVITTEEGSVITGIQGTQWRTPHTLVSKTQNFEELGVSTGDLLSIDVLNVNTNTTSSVSLQVVGVSGYSLGCVITNEAVTLGEVPEVPYDMLSSLLKDFGIQKITKSNSGSTVLSGDAKLIKDTIDSGVFQRKYFNKELTPSSDIDIRGGLFRIQPRYIVRNRFVPVSSELRSVPVLQNWIVTPEISEHDGQLFQVKNGKEYPIKSVPRSLVENSDYTVDDDTVFDGAFTFQSGSDIIKSGIGYFLDRNLRAGDTFEIVEPVTLKGDYQILAVLSNDEIRLRKPVPKYVLGDPVTANVRIKRKATGRFLRFLPGGFTAKDPAPDRLWAEASFFDNRDAIEGNFGILVGLTLDDLNKISTNVNYRQAVAGLMYAFTRGSSLERVRLGAQILLGLPFSEHRGVVRSIDPTYRLNLNGDPVLGRMLVEDIDVSGRPMGLQRIYTYPIEEGSRLAGLEINPATGQEYKVGDEVGLFVSLSKGVEIIDYLIEGLDATASGKTRLQQFHTVHMRANDSVFSFDELELVSKFLKKITPSYISVAIGSSYETFDNAALEDKLTIRRLLQGGFVDNASFGFPHSLMSDGRTVDGVSYGFWDDGFYWVRKTGNDLVTTYMVPPLIGVPVVTGSVASGGLVNPFFGEGPVSKVGDVLYIPTGPNAGKYPIAGLTDTQVIVSGLPASGFQSATQGYAVLRPLTAIVRTGSANHTLDSSVFSMEVGLRADGVMPGDTLLFVNAAGTQYQKTTITRVGGGPVPDGGSPVLSAGQVTTYPVVLGTHTGVQYYIIRESLLESPFTTFTEVMNQAGPGVGNTLTKSLSLIRILADINDELVDPSGNRFRLLDPINLYVTPPVPAGNTTFQLFKRKGRGTSVALDNLDLDFFDPADVSLSETDTAAATPGGVGLKTISLQMHRTTNNANPSRAIEAFNPVTHGVLPGDLLVLTSGANSTVDVGYGPGVYPIAQVANPNLTLTQPLTSGATSSWSIVRRR